MATENQEQSTAFENARTKLEFQKIIERVVRHASSEPGREELRKLRTITSQKLIREQLASVSESKRLIETEGALPLDGIFPIRDVVRKTAVEGAVLQPRELHEIVSTLRVSRKVKASLRKKETEYILLSLLAEGLYSDKVLEFNIDQAIDDQGEIKSNASRELESIRRSIADRSTALKKQLERILKSASSSGFSQDEIITTREGRMVIPVKAEFKNQVHGFVHSASSSGATVFVEPTETLELNNEIRTLHFQEQREIERILRGLTDQVRSVRDELSLMVKQLAEIDSIQARALYSVEIIGSEPTIAGDGEIRLVEARHPILILNHGYKEAVPITLALGGSHNTLLISGPNAGGKSVAMKCVGILVLMAQSGLHIPAGSESKLRIMTRMFVDIGDDQSIENDLSTFSSHLRNLKEIVQEADASSLVLIDEIGTGTDPAEGGALAAALLESLTCRGTLTIATTHHGTLKAFAHDTPGIENGAMEFDQSTLTPTYRFRSGIPGSSYAFEMASRMEFDKASLKRAREILGDQQSRLDELLAELEASTQESRKALDELRKERETLARRTADLEDQLHRQKKEAGEMRRRASDEARAILESANALIERTVREIRESSAQKEVVHQVRQSVHAMRESFEEPGVQSGAVDNDGKAGPIVPGTPVRIGAGSDVGEVVSVDQDRNVAIVLFGQVKMKCSLESLIRVPSLKPTVFRTASKEVEAPRQVVRDLDLRGMTGEEALPMIDKFIDDAMLAGMHRIDIIHGKGTGALRKRVTEFLSDHPRVKSFRLGEWNEGGVGATIVELAE